MDDRIVRATVEVGGGVKRFTDVYISARGTKFAGDVQNEADITIGNLSKYVRDYLITETSPYNNSRTRKQIVIEAGRVSTGYSTVFVGDIITITPTQPPDIMLKISARTGQWLKGSVLSVQQPGKQKLSAIAGQVASQIGASLQFEADDKDISNYSFTGGALDQVRKIGQTGNVNSYVDDETMVVKGWNVPLSNSLRVLNQRTGLIGIPQFTDQGVNCKFLFDNRTRVGGAIQLESDVYPSVNGQYVIYKLSFDISNRDTAFYWIAECARPGVPFRRGFAQ